METIFKGEPTDHFLILSSALSFFLYKEAVFSAVYRGSFILICYQMCNL